MLPARDGERNHIWNMPAHSVLLTKTCPQGKPGNQSLTRRGITRAQLTWKQGRSRLQPPLAQLAYLRGLKRMEKLLERSQSRGVISLGEWDRTMGLRNGASSPTPHQDTTQVLFTAGHLPGTSSCPAIKKNLQGISKGRKHDLKTQSKHQNLIWQNDQIGN